MDSFRTQVERWGLRKVLLASLYRRMNRWLGLHVFLINSRPLTDVTLSDLPEGHEARRLIAADEQQILAEPLLGLDKAFLDDAFSRGDVCIGYFVDGQLVSYFWCAFSQLDSEPGLRVQVGEGFSYAYKAQTLPEFRGQRLQEVLTHVNDKQLMAEGRTQNIEYIGYANLAQRKASARYGNITLGYVVRWQLAGIDWLYHSPGVRQTQFRFFKVDEQ